jgi:23S rRNA U2552 (ribose-2'-O)-methylase RlmE/FtsJ
MSYYLIPRTFLFTYKNIDCIEGEPKTVVSNSISYYLCIMKEKITSKEKQWDIYKKYTNPYEYIHTASPFKKKPVSKHKPLSRSFFKMVEIIQTFKMQFRGPIRTFHLAEGPGGFIEAVRHLRDNKDDIYIGMTLLDDKKSDSSIPAWKKSEWFLKSNPNVFLENGADGTGNILSFENFEYVVSKYPEKMDLITADGGFDFSVDFNQQEIFIGNLLFAQMAFAICLQKYKGKFVLKIFDCFMQHTIDILYILSSFYEKVYIMKPNTSRYANSERYIICIGFLYDNSTAFYPYIASAFKSMTTRVHRFLNIPISNVFIKKIEEYNAIFGQKQIQNIHFTLSLIENKPKYDKLEAIIQNNIEKCMSWCERYNLPYNIINFPTNMFLDSEI